MGGQSTFVKVLLILIAIILCAGFFMTIDSVSRMTVSVERLDEDLSSIREEIADLRNDLSEAGPTIALKNAAGADGGVFANMDLRDPAAFEGDAIVTAMQSESGNLNYLINNESSVGDFWGMTNDSVAERSYRNPDEWQPKLAYAWEISDDKLTYTVHLRNGVLWHDFTDPTTGESFKDVEVTADDFKFFLDVIRNPGIPCGPTRNYYEDLKEIQVFDKHTFRVVWAKRYWMSKELTLGLSPLPKHFYRFDPEKPDEFTENTERNRMIVGCGPWVFERWDKGNRFVFVRNEKYYAPKPYLKRRTIRIIKEPTARLQALRSRTLDRIGLQPEQWAEQTDDDAFNEAFRKFRYPNRAYYYIGYNMQRDPFKDRRVRLACTHLVDRKRILNDVYYGLAQIVTGPFYVKSTSYDKTVEPWPLDVDRAKELLAEAGWRDTDNDGVLDKDGARLEFTFMTISGSRIFERVAEICREDFAKAGIVVNINPVEWSVYTERLDERNFEVCMLGWSMGWDQDPYQIWHSSQIDVPKGSNHVGFRNAEVDRLIEEARRVFDVDKRSEMYHDLHRILHDEQPYTFLFTPDALVAQDRRFRNAIVYPLGMNVDVFWVAKTEQKYVE